MIKLFVPILVAIALVAAAFFLGKDYGGKTQKVECQKTEIINENENTKSLIKSAEIRNQVSAMSDDTIWSELFKSYCTDCDK